MKIIHSYFLIFAALVVQFAFSGCETQNSAADAGLTEVPAPVAENRYGADGQLIEAADGEKRSRFGFSGVDGESAADNAVDSNKREVREMTKREGDALDSANEKKESVNKKIKSGAPSNLSEYKSANKVPGDPLSVTLPGKNASLGQISIEKQDSSGQLTGQPLASGTPVAIPDPNNPGQKIYFKVP